MTIDEMMGKYGDYIKRISHYTYSQVVEDIEEFPVVWFQGAAEIGPRALGHRSILGDPSNKKTKEILNNIKQREWWRPVAPLMLEEAIEEWFEDGRKSPYMLHAFHLKKEKLGILPAIEHLDGSCRVQTINEDEDPELYKILKEMQRRKKAPVVCNTSLNDKGEPIINTIAEAMNFALRKKIKVVYINEYRIEMHNYEKFTNHTYEKRKLQHLFEIGEEELVERWKCVNPYGLSKEDIAVYLYSADVRERFNLSSQKDVRIIKMLTQRAKKKHPAIAYGGINTGCK